MSHMHGFESIRIFHERAPAIPLIAMSGYAFTNLNSPTPDFLRMAIELGATRCLRKPFTPMALLTVIKVSREKCLAEAGSSFAGAVGVELAALRPCALTSCEPGGAYTQRASFRICLP